MTGRTIVCLLMGQSLFGTPWYVFPFLLLPLKMYLVGCANLYQIIDQAIRSSCQDVESYFLVVVSANDSVGYLAVPECTQKDISKIFDLNQFLHSQRPRGAGEQEHLRRIYVLYH